MLADTTSGDASGIGNILLAILTNGSLGKFNMRLFLWGHVFSFLLKIF